MAWLVENGKKDGNVECASSQSEFGDLRGEGTDSRDFECDPWMEIKDSRCSRAAFSTPVHDYCDVASMNILAKSAWANRLAVSQPPETPNLLR
jgi:hypothetical protein